jgi:hypothetical protein
MKILDTVEQSGLHGSALAIEKNPSLGRGTGLSKARRGQGSRSARCTTFPRWHICARVLVTKIADHENICAEAEIARRTESLR